MNAIINVIETLAHWLWNEATASQIFLLVIGYIAAKRFYKTVSHKLQPHIDKLTKKISKLAKKANNGTDEPTDES